MSAIEDLVFRISSEEIYAPVDMGAPSNVVTIEVTNEGLSNLFDLGIYIVQATSLGDVDARATFPSAKDYEDLVAWGEDGYGLEFETPINSGGTITTRVDRTNGSLYDNRIDFKDLGPGDSATFTVVYTTPPGEPSRRLYIDFILE